MSDHFVIQDTYPPLENENEGLAQRHKRRKYIAMAWYVLLQLLRSAKAAYRELEILTAFLSSPTEKVEYDSDHWSLL